MVGPTRSFKNMEKLKKQSLERLSSRAARQGRPVQRIVSGLRNDLRSARLSIEHNFSIEPNNKKRSSYKQKRIVRLCVRPDGIDKLKME